MTSRTMTMFVAAAALLAAGCGGGDDKADRAGGNASAAGAPSNAAGGPGEAKETLGQAVGRADGLGAFAGAVKAAGLEGVLSSASAYTVFAPNDAAFAGAGAGGAGGDKAKLAGLIRGHIVPGVVTSEDLRAAIDKGRGKARLATLSGATLTARREGDAILVSGPSGGEARVVKADLIGSNGVAHVVDGLLAR